MAELYDRLREYATAGVTPFHMPGHKRKNDILEGIVNIDITEINNFDNLHNAEGILLDAQNRANDLYRADRTFFLINGSTVGLLAGIMSQCDRGGEILIARNSHQSVYNAVYMKELEPIYVYPKIIRELDIVGSIAPEDIELQLMNNPNIQAVVITSPTYEGVISDIRAIAGITMKHKAVLIVDEAHGAHLGITENTISNAIQAGADIIIHSLHKTLPALTQTALLHINRGKVKEQRLEQYLRMLQSSSPSYVLMASIDRCIDILINRKEQLFEEYMSKLLVLRQGIDKLKNIRLLKKTKEMFDYDETKIVLLLDETDKTGQEVGDVLRSEYNIELEYYMKKQLLAMTSVCDSLEDYQKLLEALKKIDETMKYESKNVDNNIYIPRAKKLTISKALDMSSIEMELELAIGKISAEFIIPYPPGIPLIVPGEIIDLSLLEYIRGNNPNLRKIEKIKVVEG